MDTHLSCVQEPPSEGFQLILAHRAIRSNYSLMNGKPATDRLAWNLDTAA